MCLSNGEMAPRRHDVGKPKWGHGTPTVTGITPYDNIIGIASKDGRDMQTIQTEAGPIQMGVGISGAVGYKPSESEIVRAVLRDSRLTAISDRYFR